MRGTDLLASLVGTVRNLSCGVNFGIGYVEMSCVKFGAEIWVCCIFGVATFGTETGWKEAFNLEMRIH